MEDIVIVGAGGFGREVLALINDINRVAPQWNVVGFADDRPQLRGSTVSGRPVLGPITELAQRRLSPRFVLGIGSPADKARVAEPLLAAGLEAPALVHPSVVASSSVSFSEGCVICAGTILTCDIHVGRFVTINLACTIGHDSLLGDFVTIAPGVHVSGNVVVEEGCEVGTGVATVQGRRLGAWSMVGAGAVVSSDIPPNCTAVGIPARAVKQRAPGWQREHTP